MHPDTPILQAEALSFSHSHQPATPLFDRLSLVLLPGVTWLCGDEGSGKTTLLQLLAGALPASGQLQIQGFSLAGNREAYRQQVAWLDPRDSALDTQTARQIFSAQPQRHPDFDRAALQIHIEGLSLAPHLDKALFMMSTGTRRKVLLAAAMAAQAPLTLLDQPFMALDRPSIDYLLQLLAEAARNPRRAWVVADYEAPGDVTLAGMIKLGA
ncbi:MAG: ATP-binding cassette domain-containing protein [Polaromonas sp.]